MALKIRGNTQILDESIHNEQLKDADVSLAKLSGDGSVSLLSSGVLNVSAGQLILADNQISGNKINGGVIDSVGILVVDIDGGTIDGVDINSSDIKTSDVTISAGKSFSVDSGGSINLSLAGKTGLILEDDQISGDKIEGGDISGEVTFSGNVLTVNNQLNVGSGKLHVDGSGDVSVAQKLTVNGDLEVKGNLTSINTTELEIEDKLITLGKGATSFAQADGTGIHFEYAKDSAGKSITWSHGLDRFVMDADLQTSMVHGKVSDISNHTTDDLAEGLNNFYYTDARFDSAFDAKSTSDLSEGTNLYYTQNRFDLAFNAKSTTELSEGVNLYYTQARFDSAFDDKNTDDLTEGSLNKYFTEARVRSSISVVDSAGDGSLSYDPSTGQITYRGVTQSAVHGYFSGTSGISYDNQGEFSISNDAITFDMLGCEMDDSSMETASSVTVPTSLSIKNYVDSQIANQSSSDFAAASKLEYKMSAVDNAGMINVKDDIECHGITSAEADVDNLLLDSPILPDALPFESLSMVFLNGQKLRHGSAKDYYFGDASGNEAAPLHTHIWFVGINLEHGDEVEVRRIKTAIN